MFIDFISWGFTPRWQPVHKRIQEAKYKEVRYNQGYDCWTFFFNGNVK